MPFLWAGAGPCGRVQSSASSIQHRAEDNRYTSPPTHLRQTRHPGSRELHLGRCVCIRWICSALAFVSAHACLVWIISTMDWRSMQEEERGSQNPRSLGSRDRCLACRFTIPFPARNEQIMYRDSHIACSDDEHYSIAKTQTGIKSSRRSRDVRARPPQRPRAS